MAQIVGCLAMSHAPQLMLEPSQWGLLNTRSGEALPERPELQALTLETKQRQWEACHAAIRELAARLAELAPDTVMVVGDDQHENLLDDNMPPFTVFVGDEVEASVSLRYLKQSFDANRTRYRVDTALGRWLLDELMDHGFDPAYSLKTRFEGGLGHAFGRPLKFLMPETRPAILPIMVNTYYPPAPSAKRCVAFGQTLGELVSRFREDRRVVVVASGGLSHTKIDERLDAEVIVALRGNDVEYLARMRAADLVEGTSEIRNWIIVAAAAGQRAQVTYQPLYRTTTGVGCAMGFASWISAARTNGVSTNATPASAPSPAR
jgi:aromatic ring-opening dioxygenase LigB subunit